MKCKHDRAIFSFDCTSEALVIFYFGIYVFPGVVSASFVSLLLRRSLHSNATRIRKVECGNTNGVRFTWVTVLFKMGHPHGSVDARKNE